MVDRKQTRVLRQGFLAMLCAALLLLSLRPRLFRYTASFWGVFDSVITLTASVPTREEFDWYLDLAVDSFTELHAFYDRFSKPNAIISIYTINQNAGGAPLMVEEPLFSLLRYAKRGVNRSEGTVSPTLGPITELWRQAILTKRCPPDDLALRQAAQHIGGNQLLLDEENQTVCLTDPDALLDVGSVAKGYATERVARQLSEAGLSRFALSSGGNIRCGEPPDQKRHWEIGVQSPDAAVLSDFESLATLRIRHMAVSTSGDYQRFVWYQKDGEILRAHHLIDPKTLFPAERYRSVTVACPDAADADLFSTALFLQGLEEGEALAEQEGLAVLWVMPDGAILMNRRMKQLCNG